MMSSPDAGITPPGQGAPATVELQLPLPVVVMTAANDFANAPVTKNRMSNMVNFLVVCKKASNAPDIRTNVRDCKSFGLSFLGFIQA